MNVPDTWFQWVAGVIVTALGWVVRHLHGRLSQLEREAIAHGAMSATTHATLTARVAILEQALLDSTSRLDRIELKLDRLLER